MNKTCPHCKRTLALTDFNWKLKGEKRASYCKECSRKYIKNHYLRNRKYYLQKARSRNKQIRNRAYQYIASFMLSHPCVDCGEKDILVLEFDHRDRTRKSEDVSRIIRQTGSLEKLALEISKCDVRCANCHRKKTEKENNSGKLKYAPVA